MIIISINNLNHSRSVTMDEQIMGGMDVEEEFEILQQNMSATPEDRYFNQVVMALQEIILDIGFEQIQNGFMNQHCMLFEQGEQNKIQYMQIFKDYHERIQAYLQKKLTQNVQNFKMDKFLQLLKTRTEQIDEQILEMLMSLSDFEVFKQLILDYKFSREQEERYQVLTIKSNKIPQSKTVKGSSNIFANKGPSLGISGDPLLNLKKNTSKKTAPKKQKTQDQLLTPDLVLTIRPLRKK